jgi:hypothetical protein
MDNLHGLCTWMKMSVTEGDCNSKTQGDWGIPWDKLLDIINNINQLVKT